MAKRTVVKDGYRYTYEGDRIVRVDKVETPKVQSQKDADRSARARKNYSGNQTAKVSQSTNIEHQEANTRRSAKKVTEYMPKTTTPSTERQEANSRRSAKKVSEYFPNAKKKTKPLTQMTDEEYNMRRSLREFEAYMANKEEYEFATKKRTKTGDELDWIMSDTYKKERGEKFGIDHYHNDFVDLLKDYDEIGRKFGNEYIDPKEMAEFTKKVNSFYTRTDLMREYMDIYGVDYSPMLQEMYSAISGEMDVIKNVTDNANKANSQYNSAEEFRISKITDYEGLRNKRDYYEELAKAASGDQKIHYESLVDYINEKIASPELVSTMTPDDIESEKKRFSESVYNTMQPGRNVSYTPEGYMYYDYDKAEKNFGDENSAKALSDKFDDAVKESEALRLINDYTNRTDFKSSRSAVSQKYTQDNGAALPNTSENEAKLIYNAVNGDSESIGMQRGTEAILDGRRTNIDFSVISTMTGDEIDTYNYIVNTQGLEAGSEFVKKLSGVLNKRKSDELSADAYKYAQEHPFLSLISGVLSAPISAIGDLTTTVSDIYNGATGKGIDIYDERHRGQNISSAMSQGGQSAFESPIAQFLYGTAESGGKEAMLYATTLGIGKAFNLGGKALGAINMAAHSGSAFEGKLIQYKEEGYSDASALIAGLVSAGIEAATEALPMDRLLKTPDVLSGMNTKKIVQIMKRTGVSGIEEGLEEGASMILGDIYDIATNHEKLTAYYQAYNKAIKEGKGEKEATVQGFLSAIGELGQNVLAGAFVGMGMSASNSASVVIRSDKVRSIAENYFRDNGSEYINVATLLTQFGMPADTETLNTAKNLIGLVNGKLISPELRDSINNTPELRGVVQALANIKAEGGFDTEETVDNTEPVETSAPTDIKDKPSDLFTTLTSGKLSSNQIDGIIDNPDRRQEFQELTGITLEGSKAKQRNIIKEWIRDKLNIEEIKLKKAGFESLPLLYEHSKVNDLLENPNSKNVGEILYNAKLARAFEELIGQEIPKTFDGRREFIRENAELARKVYAESKKTGRGTIRQSLYRDLDEIGGETTPTTENVSKNPKRTSFNKSDAEAVKSGIENINTDEQFANMGRSAAKVYSNYVSKDSGLVKKFVDSGMTVKAAQTTADSIFQFMYYAGKRGAKLDVASNIMEKIHPGIKEYTTAFYYAGVNDRASMSGKKGAKIVENDTVKSLRASNILDERQEKAINTIANRLGIDVEFVEDLGEGNNGSFNVKTGQLKISRRSEIPFVEAVLHESVHAIRSISPKSYNNMADLVFEILSADSDALSGAWKYIASIYRGQIIDKKGNLNRELVNEELVANVMSKLLFNEQYVNELAGIDTGLVQRVWNALKDFFDRVFKRYKRTPFISLEMEDAMKLLHKEYDKLERIYKDALGATRKVRTENGVVIAENGEIVAMPDQSEIMFNKAQWDKNGRKFLESYFKKNKIDADMASQVMEFMDMMAKASKSFESEFPLYGNWAVYEVEKGENGAPMSAIVKNGEYTLNIDFSTKCVKRATLDRVLNRLANRRMLSLIKAKDDNTAIAVINGIIKKHGLDVACPMCFVDSKRQNILKWSKSFVDMWNWVTKQVVPKGEVISDFAFAGQNTSNTVDTLTEADFEGIENKVPRKFKTDKGNIKPILLRIINLMKSDSKYIHTMTVEDMASSEGLDAIKRWSEDMYNIVNSHQGSAKPKLAHSEVPYANDIASDKRFNAESAFMVGGVRFQSFSDYVPSLFFDYMQAVAELSAKGLPSHAYTKVIDFAKIFGLTGMKINMSGIPKVAELTAEQQARIDALYKDGKKSSKFHNDSLVRKLKKNAGLDADGNLLWADESIDIEEAKKLALDPEYSKNCGIIVVGVSNAHIKKLLDTDWVAQVIPYHRSGINPVVARMYNIDLFNDYTNQQNTRVPYQGKYKSINATEIKIKDFDFYGELKKLGNDPDAPKKIADRYLEWCYKAGDLSRTELAPENKRFIPKFDTFKEHPNYYKLLADFSMKDVNGNYTPQEAVKMNFPKTETLFGYIKDSLESQKVREAKIDAEFDRIVDEVEEAFDIEEGEMLSKSPNRTSKLKGITPEYVRGEVTHDFESFKKLVIETMDEEIAKAKTKPSSKVKAPTTADIIENSTYIGDDGQKVVIVPEGTPGAEKVYVSFDYESSGNPTERTGTGEPAKSRVPLTALRSNVLNNEHTKSVIDLLKNDDSFGTYFKFTDEAALGEAERRYEEKGYKGMLESWKSTMESGALPTKQTSTDGMFLLKKASEHDDGEAVIYILSELQPLITNSAQIVQSVNILARKLSGESRAYMAVKSLKKLESKIRQKRGNEGVTLEFPKELVNEYIKAVNYELGISESSDSDSDVMSAKSDTRRSSDEILAEMWSAVAEDLPTSWAETFNLWRYASMLMSPATHISNALSNYAHYTNTLSKNMYASLIESVAIRDKNKRTKSVGASIKSFLPGGIRKKVDKLYNFAIDDAEKIKNDLKGDNKYDVDKTSRSKFKIVEKIGEGIFGALKWEDWVMMRGHYARALSSFMQARGYKPSTITETQLDEGRKIAIEEARRATFNETNAFSQMLNEAARKNKAVEFVIGSEIPFAKVPANVLRTGVDYSPLGFVRTIGNIFNKDIDANTKIDMLARNLTGTQTFVLGAMLFAAGILSVSGDDEETEEKLYGAQKYSINFGDKSWSLDWMAPAGIALFAGAQFWHDVTAEDGKFEIIDLIKAVPAIGESTMNILFEMTMLENLAYTIKSWQYGDGWGEKVADSISSAVFGYLGQFIPTPVGQIAKSIDNTKRGTYIDKSSKIPSYVQVGLQQLVRKIPFLYSKLEPTVNEHGEPEKNSVDNVVLRTIDNLILPGSLKKLRSNAIDDELMRLYKEAPNGKDALPKKLAKHIGEGEERKDLTAKEYARMQTVFGQTYYGKLKEIIGTDYYNNLSDENKVKLLKKVKEYATEKAKDEIDSRFVTNGWLKISMETPGVFEYILDTDVKSNFTEDDIAESDKSKYEADRDASANSVLSFYNPVNAKADYEFSDKYFENLSTFSKTLNLDKYSNGKFEYSSSNKWVSTIKDWNAKEQAEYIYGRTLRSQYDDQDEANQALQNDRFITDRPRMYLLKDSFGADKSPGTLYNKYLKDSGADEITWGKLWEKYNNTPTEINGKKNDRKKIMVAEINKLRISNEQKTRMYYALGYGTSDKGLKGVPWAFVRIPEFEKESE